MTQNEKQININNINMKMSNKVKDVNIKKRTYYFFNDIIDIENFDSNNIKIDEKSYKNILIYYIGYVTIKKYVKICSIYLLYFILRYINGKKGKKKFKNMKNCGLKSEI